MKRLSLLLFVLSIFFTISCASYYQRLSDVSSTYAPYDGSHLDPLKEHKVKKFRIGEKKYDEFFKTSDKAYIAGEFSKRAIKSYKDKSARNEDVSDEKKAVAALLADFTNSKTDPINLAKAAKELLESAKSDFSGANAYKGAEVAQGLNDSIGKLETLASEMPDIMKDLKKIASGKGIPVKGSDPGTEYRRARLRELLYEYETLRGERFSGTLLPMRFYKVPREIQDEYNVTGKILLLAKSSSGKTKIIVLVPDNMGSEIGAKISAGEKMDLVYTPIGVYKKVYPIVELVENPKQMKDEVIE